MLGIIKTIIQRRKRERIERIQKSYMENKVFIDTCKTISDAWNKSVILHKIND